MDNYKQGKLSYNSESDRFGLLIADLWGKEFHCGNTLDYYDNDREVWVPTRIEISWPEKQYYLVGTGLKGDDLEGLRVRISEDD